MFRSRTRSKPPKVMTCSANEVEPGDEVVVVEPSGAHRALRPAYVVIDPAKTSVRLVMGDGPECQVGYDEPVMVIRGADLTDFLPSPAGRPPRFH